MAKNDTAEHVPVVLHYRNGHTETVLAEPKIDRRHEIVGIVDGAKRRRKVAFDELKAVFFLYGTDKRPTDVDLHGATDLVIEFRDGERMYGRSVEYSADRNGFVLYPADRSKNDRIFVVNSAIVSVDVVKL